MSDLEIIEGMLRVEAYNDQYRKPNPKGRYPICRPGLRDKVKVCTRCGQIIDPEDRKPCAAVPPEERWGEDYTPKEAAE